jgi:hypothetical protein
METTWFELIVLPYSGKGFLGSTLNVFPEFLFRLGHRKINFYRVGKVLRKFESILMSATLYQLETLDLRQFCTSFS